MLRGSERGSNLSGVGRESNLSAERGSVRSVGRRNVVLSFLSSSWTSLSVVMKEGLNEDLGCQEALAPRRFADVGLGICSVNSVRAEQASSSSSIGQTRSSPGAIGPEKFPDEVDG